jgi:D-alanine-D-alanine ligase
MADLRHLVLTFEPESACRDRLVTHGFPAEIAVEIAVYLAQATDLVDYQEMITEALAAEGLEVTFVALDDLLDALRTRDPGQTMVWCQTDGFRFYRGSAVPALARLGGFARYGSPAHVQHICQDKFASLALAAGARLPVPPTRLMEGGQILAALRDDDTDWERTTLFVKPATLGAKIGIFADSRCEGFGAARGLADRIWERYRDRAVVQPFVEGDDVRVSFMDVGRSPEAQIGIARLQKNPESETGGAFMTMRDNETLSGARDTAGSRGAFGRAHAAAFTPSMDDLQTTDDPQARAGAAAILDHAVRLQRLLPLRDYWSMDFRLDAEGRPTFFEFETCPAVTIYDFQHYLAATHGLVLGPALARSLRRAFARSGDRLEA